jgi:single stranded DNA-binding protein
MNQLTLTGRLTEDPELRELPSGTSVCRMRLAVDGMAGGGETGYVNVSEFGKSGEASARVLAKGWLVAVQGRLEQQHWETQEGQRRHDYGVVGHVEFLAAPRGETREQETQQARTSESEQEAEAGDPRSPGSASRQARPAGSARKGTAREAAGAER